MADATKDGAITKQFTVYAEPGIVNLPNKSVLGGVRPPLSIGAEWLEEARRRWDIRKQAIRDRRTKGDSTFRVWEVESDSRPVTYFVRSDGQHWTCTCPGYVYHGRCKHIARCKRVQALQREASSPDL